jgi:regulator of sirC expression with transglutaminase-like and TPR domain
MANDRSGTDGDTGIPAGLERFARLVRRRPGEVPLVAASLEIARQEYPHLDELSCMNDLQALEQAARQADPGPGTSARARLEALNRVLFQEAGFHGDPVQAGDPQCSYLNRVLVRRTGLPILLAVVYLEIGRRLGLALEGVGMPAHFIVRLMGEEPALFVDPFHRGKIMQEEDCRVLLSQVTRGKVDMQPEYLRPWSTPRILERMLRNLKAVYVQGQDYPRARRVVDLLLVLRPGAVDELRDRGMLAYHSLLFEMAVEDLELYLERVPRAADATAIRAQLQSLRRLVPSHN